MRRSAAADLSEGVGNTAVGPGSVAGDPGADDLQRVEDRARRGSRESGSHERHAGAHLGRCCPGGCRLLLLWAPDCPL